MSVDVRAMAAADVDGVVGLQRACFPAPFPEDLLWSKAQVMHHLKVFPSGQFVATLGGNVVGSASSAIISEEIYSAHLNWEETLGGHCLLRHRSDGSTLYGVDISVHPEFRGLGIARRLYEARFDLVSTLKLTRYATGCRVPGFGNFSHDGAYGDLGDALSTYCALVVAGDLIDPTLTPLLRMGLKVVGTHTQYMEDEESRNCAALLEWTPGTVPSS